MKIASAPYRVMLPLFVLVFLGSFTTRPSPSCGADAELKPEDKEFLEGCSRHSCLTLKVPRESG